MELTRWLAWTWSCPPRWWRQAPSVGGGLLYAVWSMLIANTCVASRIRRLRARLDRTGDVSSIFELGGYSVEYEARVVVNGEERHPVDALVHGLLSRPMALDFTVVTSVRPSSQGLETSLLNEAAMRKCHSTDCLSLGTSTLFVSLPHRIGAQEGSLSSLGFLTVFVRLLRVKTLAVELSRQGRA